MTSLVGFRGLGAAAGGRREGFRALVAVLDVEFNPGAAPPPAEEADAGADAPAAAVLVASTAGRGDGSACSALEDASDEDATTARALTTSNVNASSATMAIR